MAEPPLTETQRAYLRAFDEIISASTCGELDLARARAEKRLRVLLAEHDITRGVHRQRKTRVR